MILLELHKTITTAIPAVNSITILKYIAIEITAIVNKRPVAILNMKNKRVDPNRNRCNTLVMFKIVQSIISTVTRKFEVNRSIFSIR